MFDIEKFLNFAKKIIPKRIFKKLQPIYHWLMAFLSAVIYRFPSRKIFVVGVTGTKGKTTTVELISAILEEADVLDALRALGYSLSEAREALKKVPKDIEGAQNRIKEALKLLGK